MKPIRPKRIVAPSGIREAKLLCTPLQRRLGRSPPELWVLRQRTSQTPFDRMAERWGASGQGLEVRASVEHLYKIVSGTALEHPESTYNIEVPVQHNYARRAS